MSSDLERKFETLFKQVAGAVDDDVPELIAEHQFFEGRKWRFDFAHKQTKVAVECEGGVYSGGRHTRGAGFEKDCEKYNAAALAGWAVFRVTSNMLDTDPHKHISMVLAAIYDRAGQTEDKQVAQEGEDITLVEPITVAAIEPEVVSVDVATTEPAEQPDIKLLPAHIPHPYKDATAVFVRGYGQQVYEVKATGWLSGKPTVTVAIGKGIRTKSFDIETKKWEGADNDILWTVFADRVSIENPFIKKATEDIAA